MTVTVVTAPGGSEVEMTGAVMVGVRVVAMTRDSLEVRAPVWRLEGADSREEEKSVSGGGAVKAALEGKGRVKVVKVRVPVKRALERVRVSVVFVLKVNVSLVLSIADSLVLLLGSDASELDTGSTAALVWVSGDEEDSDAKPAVLVIDSLVLLASGFNKVLLSLSSEEEDSSAELVLVTSALGEVDVLLG